MSSRKKKGTKGKEKKLKRLAEQQARQAKLAVIQRALFNDDGTERDVLKDAAAFSKFSGGDVHATLQFKTGSTLSAELKDFIFNLTKENMQKLYEDAPGWGWSDSNKRRELFDEAARYLVAYTQDGEPMGFAHFRFTYESESEVLYLYELQVAEKYRNKGLGKHLMQTLEIIGFKLSMKWLLLTVFKRNAAALRFYLDRLKYDVHETSPSMSCEDAPHEILGKCLDRTLASQPLDEQVKERRLAARAALAVALAEKPKQTEEPEDSVKPEKASATASE